MMTLGPAKVVKRPLKTEWCFHHEEEEVNDSETIEPLIEPRDKSEFLTSVDRLRKQSYILK